MRAQQQFRVSTAPLTAGIVLLVTLVLGGAGGYAVGTATRSTAGVPQAEVASQSVGPAALPIPAAAGGIGAVPGETYSADEGEYCRYGPAMECLRR